MIHELKIAPEHFNAILDGTKTFEVRSEADRIFSVGDVLMLKEYKVEEERYTGGWVCKTVTYVMRDKEYCKPGMAILGIRR